MLLCLLFVTRVTVHSSRCALDVLFLSYYHVAVSRCGADDKQSLIKQMWTILYTDVVFTDIQQMHQAAG